MKSNYSLLLKYLILVACLLSTANTASFASVNRPTCIQEEKLKAAEKSIVDVLVDDPDYEHDEFLLKAVVVSQNRLIVLGMYTVLDLYLGKDKNQPLVCITPKAFNKDEIPKDNPYCNSLAPHCIHNVAVCSLKSGKNWNLPTTNMPLTPLSPMLKGEFGFATDFYEHYEYPNPPTTFPCTRKLVVDHAANFSSTASPDSRFIRLRDTEMSSTSFRGSFYETGGPIFAKRGNEIVVAGLIRGAETSGLFLLSINEWSEKSPLRNFLDCALKPGPLPKNCN